MPMPPIQFHVAMFRGEWDQARSQFVLLLMMEALTRINQTLLRQNHSMIGRGMVPPSERIPELYRAGIHYEREPPGQEEWPDIDRLLKKTGQEWPGRWGDCEDLSCWLAAELRELDQHQVDEKGLLVRPGIKPVGKVKTVKGGVKAKPFAKWRRGPTGAFHYHALVMLPDGRLEDPSLVLGMGKEAIFAERDIANRLASRELDPKIQFAVPPKVMVVDNESPTGYNDRRTEKNGSVGVPGAAEWFSIKDKNLASIMGDRFASDADPRINWKPARWKLGQDAVAPTAAPAAPVATAMPAAPATPVTPTVTQEDVTNIMKRLENIERSITPAPPEPWAKGFAKRSIKSEVFRQLNELAKAFGA